ncbi:MAG TPA: hypothetical protein VGA56_10455 [Opitutaceae bacterium]
MTTELPRWDAPSIDDGPETTDVAIIGGLRALRRAQQALERAAQALEDASQSFADADFADVDGLLTASRVALHSAVNRRVAAAVFALRNQAARVSGGTAV